MRMQFLVPLLLAAICPMAMSVSAQLTTFHDQTTFLAAAGAVNVESFEGAAISPRSANPLSLAAFTITPAPGLIGVLDGPAGGFGASATDGTKFLLSYRENQPAGTLRFDLNAPATAFGFFLIDDGEIDGLVSLHTDAGETLTETTVLQAPPILSNGNVAFFGFVQNTPFSQVFLTSTGIDELVWTRSGVYHRRDRRAGTGRSPVRAGPRLARCRLAAAALPHKADKYLLIDQRDEEQTMRRYAAGLALLGCGLGLIAWRTQGMPPDLRSPKAAVQSFIDALKHQDSKALAACVQGAQDNADLGELLKRDGAMGLSMSHAEISDLIEIDYEGGVNTGGTGPYDKAKVAVDVTMEVTQVPGQPKTRARVSVVELFTLRKEGDMWRIVPNSDMLLSAAPAGTTARAYGLRPLSQLVAFAANPAMLVSVRAQAAQVTCISNQKQIALGILMYVQDYDEMYPPKKAVYEKVTSPYIKNMDVFRCPLDVQGTISYTFNANMQGVSLAALVSPAKTVMTYEGKNQHLEFRHSGKTVVGFADGHVKLISPDEAKDVYWYPSGKTAPVAAPPKPKHSVRPRKK